MTEHRRTTFSADFPRNEVPRLHVVNAALYQNLCDDHRPRAQIWGAALCGKGRVPAQRANSELKRGDGVIVTETAPNSKAELMIAAAIDTGALRIEKPHHLIAGTLYALKERRHHGSLVPR